MADATGFLFVEDHDDNCFYIQLPGGEQSDWAGNDEVAILDDGARTYIATNCDDFPGMQAGRLYTPGAQVAAEVIDYADMAEDEEEDAEEEEEDVVVAEGDGAAADEEEDEEEEE